MTHLGLRALTVSVCLIGSLTGTAAAETIAAGASHTVVLKPDGTVATFGLNNNGQLGDNLQTTRKTSVDVTGLRSTRHARTASSPDPTDTTPPVITLTEPTSARPVPPPPL